MKKYSKMFFVVFLVVGLSFIFIPTPADTKPTMIMFRGGPGNGGGGGGGGPPSGDDDPVDPPSQVIPWGIDRVNAIEAAALVDESGVDVPILLPYMLGVMIM
jgi:hypothetical protein